MCAGEIFSPGCIQDDPPSLPRVPLTFLPARSDGLSAVFPSSLYSFACHMRPCSGRLNSTRGRGFGDKRPGGGKNRDTRRKRSGEDWLESLLAGLAL